MEPTAPRTGTPSHELALFLSDQLRPALPPAVEIDVVGADVIVRFDVREGSNSMAAVLDEDDGRSFDERVETAAWAILSHVQDAAVAASSTPWPGVVSPLPLPRAEVVGGRLVAWFGEREAPVLTFGDIEIAALLR